MTVATETARNQYIGTGITGPFPYTFPIVAPADLDVIVRDAVTGVEITLGYPADYTVTGAGQPSGSITLTLALAVGEILVIRRAEPYTQGTNFRNAGPFFAGSHEDAFDHVVRLAQQLLDAVARAPRVQRSYDPALLNLEVKPETGKVLAWLSPTQLGNVTLDSSAVALPGESRTVSTLSAYLANNKVYNVKDYGAVGDGVTDDTTKIQNAIAACQASPARGFVMLPPGSYKTSSSLLIAANGVSLIGAGGGRYSQNGGSQLLYYGTGACVQIGTSKIGGSPLFHANYETGDYDGFQFTRVKGINFKHNNPDTVLANGQQSYKAGSIAVQDWRGGNTVVEDCMIEQFDYPFWSIQSDFNSFRDIKVLYAHSGWYLGPRSDQNKFSACEFTLCDTAIWLDRVWGPRLSDISVVGCGSATTPPIKIKSQYTVGSRVVLFDSSPWFERQQGFVGTVPAFIEIGKAGAVVEGPIFFEKPLLSFTNVSTITSYFLEIDQANEVYVAKAGGTFNLLTKFAKFSGTGSAKLYPSAAPDTLTQPNYDNTSSGAPEWRGHEQQIQVLAQRNANATLTGMDAGITPVTCAGGNVTITLPSAAVMRNRILTIKRTDSSGNTLTVQRAGADTIDGGTSTTIAALGVLRLIPDFPGTAWLVL